MVVAVTAIELLRVALTSPAFLRLAAHSLRWQLLAALADGDHRVRELAARIDQPQNLVSYHLWLLRNAGLGRSCPSATPDPTLTGNEDSASESPVSDPVARPIATPFRPTAAHRARSYTAGRACREAWLAVVSVTRRGLDMSASHPCDPGEPGELSSREKKILAAIEQEIHTTDPALARHLERRKRPKTRTPLRAAIRHGTLLIIALVILIVATAVLPSDSWIVLGLLTTVLLVPWILLFPPTARPRANGRRRR